MVKYDRTEKSPCNFLVLVSAHTLYEAAAFINFCIESKCQRQWQTSLNNDNSDTNQNIVRKTSRFKNECNVLIILKKNSMNVFKQ